MVLAKSMVSSVTIRKSLKYILLAIVIFFPFTIEVFASQTNWITLLSIKDTTGNAVVPEGQPLLAGHSYNITFQVDIPFSQVGSNFEIGLDNAMISAGPQYWYLLTKNYGGLDPSTFTPSEKAINFKQVEGRIKLAVIFTVPIDLTVKQSDGIAYRFMKVDYQLVQVTVTGGSNVGKLILNISDSAIENYLKAVNQKSNLIPTGQVDKSFEPLIKSILAQAEVIYRMGLPEKATDILNVINSSNIPAPPNNSLQMIMLGGLAVVLIIAAVMFVMYSRVKSKALLRASVIDDARNELASFEVTAARYDDTLSSQLKRLREKLGEEV